MSAKNDKFINQYLVFYNATLFIGWFFFLVWQLTHAFSLDRIAIITLNVCQLLALLEIFHAYKKWVNTPLFTGALQVSSRIFVLFWINVIPHENMIGFWGIEGIHIVTVAWSLTEIVRYRHYTLVLLNKEQYWLTFLRYTLFIVLYPIGVAGEMLILLSVLKWNQWEIGLINIVIVLVMLTYLPFFPKLYGYMWQQRKKKLVDNKQP